MFDRHCSDVRLSSSVGVHLLLFGSQSEPTTQSVILKFKASSHRHKTTHEYVAIKILSAHATLLIDGKLNPEIIVNELISSADSSHPGHQKCLSTTTTFRINSIAGKHICLVLPLMNGSIIDLRPPAGNLFAMPVAKRIIKDVLLGLDYLHTRCGYVHTGTYASSTSLHLDY